MLRIIMSVSGEGGYQVFRCCAGNFKVLRLRARAMGRKGSRTVGVARRCQPQGFYRIGI
jgi:hypothetical protein